MTEKELEQRLTQKAEECRSAEIETPDIGFFSGLVRSERKREEKRRRLQFRLFLAAVAAAISLMVFFVFINIQILFFMQLIPLIVFFILMHRSRRMEAGK